MQGEQYQFTCDKDQKWTDRTIVTTPDGYFNFFGWLAGMRVKGVKCFCLVAIYGDDDKTGFAIGSNKLVSITKTGLLSFFANDTKGYYDNNSGSIQVTISRVK